MDVLGTLNRWLISKTGEMHQFYEKWVRSKCQQIESPVWNSSSMKFTPTTENKSLLNTLLSWPFLAHASGHSTNSDNKMGDINRTVGMFTGKLPSGTDNLNSEVCSESRPNCVQFRAQSKTSGVKNHHMIHGRMYDKRVAAPPSVNSYSKPYHGHCRPSQGIMGRLFHSSEAPRQHIYPYNQPAMADPSPAYVTSMPYHQNVPFGYPINSYGYMGDASFSQRMIGGFSQSVQMAPIPLICYIIPTPSGQPYHLFQPQRLLETPMGGMVGPQRGPVQQFCEKHQYLLSQQANCNPLPFAELAHQQPCIIEPRTSFPSCTQSVELAKHSSLSEGVTAGQSEPQTNAHVSGGGQDVEALQKSVPSEETDADHCPSQSQCNEVDSPLLSSGSTCIQEADLLEFCSEPQNAQELSVENVDSETNKTVRTCENNSAGQSKFPKLELEPKLEPGRASTCNSQKQAASNGHKKKRKARPSAEKRRRRRMAATITSIQPQVPTPDKTEKQKLRMSATVAFILGLETDSEDEDAAAAASAAHSVLSATSSSLSSCDDDSDFDQLSDDDVTDGVCLKASPTWDEITISLERLNPFNKFADLPGIDACPSPKQQQEQESLHRSSSAPELRRMSSKEAVSLPAAKHAKPTESSTDTSPGKHVKFASDDHLVTVHVIAEHVEAYQEARRGPWEVYARDRSRFQDRIKEIEKCISFIFEADHRQRVRQRLERQVQLVR